MVVHFNAVLSKSCVTARVAVYTSDIYQVADRQASLSKNLPKPWREYMQAKTQLFGAISHLHTGSNSKDRPVAERVCRLNVAKYMVQKAYEFAPKHGILTDIINQYIQTIHDALICVEGANDSIHHETPFDPRLLMPLKRPIRALVNPREVLELKDQYPDLLEKLITPKQIQEIQELLKVSAKKSQEDQASLISLTSQIESLLSELKKHVSVPEFNLKKESKLLLDTIKDYQADEKVISSQDLIKCLRKSNRYQSECLDLCQSIVQYAQESESDTDFNFEFMGGVHKDLLTKADYQSSQITEIEAKFLQTVTPFSPMSWDIEKLGTLIASVKQTDEQFDKEFQIEKDNVQKLKSSVDDALLEHNQLEKQTQIQLVLLKNINEQSCSNLYVSNYLDAIVERRVQISSCFDQTKVLHDKIKALYAKIADLQKIKTKANEFFGSVNTQKELVTDFLKGIRSCVSFRSNIYITIQTFLTFRRISARLVGSCLKIDFSNLYGHRSYDPLIAKAKNMVIRWKELDFAALEKQHETMNAKEIYDLLSDEYILPLLDSKFHTNADYWKNLHAKAEFSVSSSESKIETPAFEVFPHSERAPYLKRIYKGFKESVAILVRDGKASSKQLFKEPASNNFNQSLDRCMPDNSDSESEKKERDELVSKVLKENARLRNMFVELRRNISLVEHGKNKAMERSSRRVSDIRPHENLGEAFQAGITVARKIARRNSIKTEAIQRGDSGYEEMGIRC